MDQFKRRIYFELFIIYGIIIISVDIFMSNGISSVKHNVVKYKKKHTHHILPLFHVLTIFAIDSTCYRCTLYNGITYFKPKTTICLWKAPYLKLFQSLLLALPTLPPLIHPHSHNLSCHTISSARIRNKLAKGLYHDAQTLCTQVHFLQLTWSILKIIGSTESWML